MELTTTPQCTLLDPGAARLCPQCDYLYNIVFLIFLLIFSLYFVNISVSRQKLHTAQINSIVSSTSNSLTNKYTSTYLNQHGSSTPTTPPRNHNPPSRRKISIRLRLPNRSLLPLRTSSLLLLALPLPPLRPRIQHHLSSHWRQARPSASTRSAQWCLLRNNGLPAWRSSADASHR